MRWLEHLEGKQFWPIFHGALMLLAAVGVSVGFIASVMYLVQVHRLKTKQLPGKGLKLWSLERLEQTYVENWSFRLDLRIMIKTIGVMISGEGAY